MTTSQASFSGAEELAYDLQVTKRGRVVGESTGGSANPNEAFDLGGGFVALIPNGAASIPSPERTGKASVSSPRCWSTRRRRWTSLNAWRSGPGPDDRRR